jgi:SAM-dependent methyltransferase
LNDTGLEHHLHHQAGTATEFFWHRLRWRTLQDHLPSDAAFRVLDVGAGNGVLGDLVLADHPQATYLFDEPIPSLAARLSERFGSAANGRDRASWDDVDVVAVLDVIEHLDDPRTLLADICDRCRSGALLAITVPGSERLWSQWDVTLGHRRRYSRRALRELLDSLPVEVVEISWLFPELTPAARWRAMRNPPRPGTTAVEAPAAEFPVLPRRLNDLLYYAGLVPVRLRRWVPFGTSLFAAARIQ